MKKSTPQRLSKIDLQDKIAVKLDIIKAITDLMIFCDTDSLDEHSLSYASSFIYESVIEVEEAVDKLVKCFEKDS